MKAILLKYNYQLKFMVLFLFWSISVSAWLIVFNPAVESINPIQGLQNSWGQFILTVFLICIYLFLPFIWFFRKFSKKIKIVFTILFILTSLFFIIYGLFNESELNITVYLVYYIFNHFFYVIIFHVPIVTAVYLNIKYLIPEYLNKNKFKKYLLFLAGLTAASSLSYYVLFDLFIDNLLPSLFYITYFHLWEFILIVLSYLLFTSVVFLIWQYINMLHRIKEQTQNELMALKAQINPHFLFNNLNTIYSMALTNDKRTKEVVLQLSDFLRYVLYDTTSKTISLKKEVEIIETYVKLQQERINPNITPITLHIEGNLDQAEISPLLLLPVAENCFKHGIGKKPGIINIYIRYDGNQLLYKTENTIAIGNHKDEINSGGIGLENIKKQLNLLYPGKYFFNAEEKEGIFRVELAIELQKRNQDIPA